MGGSSSSKNKAAVAQQQQPPTKRPAVATTAPKKAITLVLQETRYVIPGVATLEQLQKLSNTDAYGKMQLSQVRLYNVSGALSTRFSGSSASGASTPVPEALLHQAVGLNYQWFQGSSDLASHTNYIWRRFDANALNHWTDNGLFSTSDNSPLSGTAVGLALFQALGASDPIMNYFRGAPNLHTFDYAQLLSVPPPAAQELRIIYNVLAPDETQKKMSSIVI